MRRLCILAWFIPIALFAETNITEDVVLTSDTDWRSAGVANISATVNLNGYKLYTAGVKGSGTVLSATNTNYKFYRYICDATSGPNFQVCEIEFLTPDGTKISQTPSAIHWDDSGYDYLGLKEDYVAAKAFDGSLGTEWYDHRMNEGKVWVIAEFAEPVLVAGYRWYVGLDTNLNQGQKYRNPVSWRIQASNDMIHWIDLDVVQKASCITKNKALAYTCFFGSGELHVDVPAGEEMSISDLNIAGSLKLVKEGEGTLTLAKSGQSYQNGICIRKGILRPALRGRDSYTIFGTPKRIGGEIDIVIEDGAQFLDDIYCYGSLYNVHWTIAGSGPDGTGAIRTIANSEVVKVNNLEVPWGNCVTLKDDAVIGCDEYAFNFIADYYTPFTLSMNGYKLTLKTNGKVGRQWPYFIYSNVHSVGEGILEIEDDLIFFSYSSDSVLSGITLVITEKAELCNNFNSACNLTVSNLVNRSVATTSQSRKLTTVLGTYAPVSTACAPKVMLGDSEHLKTVLDLSERTTPFDIAFGGGLTFQEGSTVTVNIGSHKRNPKVLSWSKPPENVIFKSGTKGRKLKICNDGLYFIEALKIKVM